MDTPRVPSTNPQYARYGLGLGVMLLLLGLGLLVRSPVHVSVSYDEASREVPVADMRIKASVATITATSSNVLPVPVGTSTPVRIEQQKVAPVSRAVPVSPVAVKPPRAVASSSPSVRASTSAKVVPFKKAIATVFWVGEDASSDNGYIHNRASAWDEDWVDTFGGTDEPYDRCGYRPCAFVPKQNPFYVALPYLEYKDGEYKKSARKVPWYTKEALEAGTLLHGRWVEVRVGSKTCYGQWRDAGPFGNDDFAYVFGSATAPDNTVADEAGLDVSPAMRDCLNMEDVSTAWWRHVDEREVPAGPWR
ncbi:MAG: hypothetical protein KBD21_04775 [Candidatus Pacebacteria bacterium]|nr:hypothetical protein [Candidatus Paceibacterota bacterium]